MSITHCVLILFSVGNLTICLGTIIQEISKTSMLLNLSNMLFWCSAFFNETTVKLKHFCLKPISEDSQRICFCITPVLITSYSLVEDIKNH